MKIVWLDCVWLRNDVRKSPPKIPPVRERAPKRHKISKQNRFGDSRFGGKIIVLLALHVLTSTPRRCLFAACKENCAYLYNLQVGCGCAIAFEMVLEWYLNMNKYTVRSCEFLLWPCWLADKTTTTLKSRWPLQSYGIRWSLWIVSSVLSGSTKDTSSVGTTYEHLVTRSYLWYHKEDGQ